MRILLADDDFRTRSIVQLWLNRNGHEVHQAANGLEALEKLQEQPFDALISDINMPMLNGLELVRKLLDNHQQPPLVLLLSSRCDLADVRKQFNHPNVHCRQKPFRPSELAAFIEEHRTTEAPS